MAFSCSSTFFNVSIATSVSNSMDGEQSCRVPSWSIAIGRDSDTTTVGTLGEPAIPVELPEPEYINKSL